MRINLTSVLVDDLCGRRAADHSGAEPAGSAGFSIAW